MVAPSVMFPEDVAQSIHQMEFARNLNSMGHDVNIIARRPKGSPPTEVWRWTSSMDPGGYRIDYDGETTLHRVRPGEIPLKRPFFTKRAKSIAKELTGSTSFDVIHDRGYLFGGAGIKVGQRSGLPSVLQIDDHWIETEARASMITSTTFYKEKALSWCKKAVPAATQSFTISTTLKRKVVEEWGADPSKVVTIPNGVDETRFRKEGDTWGLRDRFGLQDSRVAIFTGAIGPWHGTDRFINDLPSVIQEIPDLQAVIVGGSDNAVEELRKQAASVGIGDKVHFTGRVSHEDVPKILREADVAVAPYPPEDLGFCPFKILEYMAMEIPTVATDLPSLREIINDGEDGVLVDAHTGQWGLAMLIALEDRMMGQRAREKILSRFTWRRSTEALLDLYETAQVSV